MSTEKRHPDGTPTKKVSELSPEERENLIHIMLGERHVEKGAMSKKNAKPAESHPDEKPPGSTLPETPQWIYDMAERYGEPTVSLDELREMMDKELGGESLSDFLIQDRKKNPY